MPVKNSKPYSVMKKEKTEELFVKWIDGLLTSEEEVQLAALVKDDPGIEAGLQEMKVFGETMKSEIPGSVEPPYGDFFNSKLMRKVDLQIQSQRPAKKAERWRQSMRWAWAPAGALALVLSFFAGHRLARPADPGVAQVEKRSDRMSELPTVYFTGESLEAKVISDSLGNVSAIVVNGLSAISDDIDFVTVNTSASLPESYESSEARRFH